MKDCVSDVVGSRESSLSFAVCCKGNSEVDDSIESISVEVGCSEEFFHNEGGCLAESEAVHC